MKPTQVPAAATAPQARQVGVIDIGATSLRMVIAQIDAAGTVSHLESVQQSVELGRDTFTKGYIRPKTTENCVEALKSFRRLLDEYGINRPDQVRAVATSAVREASNRDAFLDRMYIGSGINVDDTDESTVNRYTYLCAKPVLESHRALARADTLIVEVGGGSTEVIVVQNRQVTAAQSYRLGSLRMREMLEDFRAPADKLPGLLENQILATVSQIRHNTSFRRKPHMLLLGGDARLAAQQLKHDWSKSSLACIPVADLGNLTQKILRLSVDDIVRSYHLSYPSAETLGPALLAYTRLAEAMGLSSVYVTDATMRDGVLAEMAGQSWTDDFRAQIVNSALGLAKKYDCDLRHAKTVADLSRTIYRALAGEHRLPSRYELILVVASLLHDTGLFINNRSHHKHSMYLIQNSDIFGLGSDESMLAALIARYHRKSPPKPTHEEYAALDREGRIAVCKLAAILRVADALDREHSAQPRSISVTLEPGTMVITIGNATDLTVEQFGLQQKGPMFEQVYGMTVTLRPGNRE